MKDKGIDCHRLLELDQFIGQRAIITTSKGTVKGRLQYMDGWYFCQAPFRLVNNEWVQSHYRFMFRKGQFKHIEKTRLENSLGL